MKKNRGFTLIEILIAVTIAAILAVMAFSAMRQALDNRTLIQTRSARLLAVQTTLRNLVQDLSQMQPRPMRDPLGDSHLAALIGATAASPEITFTRGGWTNYAGTPRSSLQRVRYALRDGALYRDYWLVLDPQLDPLPMSRKLLDGVKDFQVRYMDDSRNWQQSWPPTSVAGSAAERELRWRPIAVEISLTLDDWGTLTRLIEVAG
jgi:general secretion pathway protein J